MTRELNACLEGITVPDFDGDLTVTAADATEFPLRCPGWLVVELFPIWPNGPGEADIVGSFTDLGGIDGQLAQAVYRTGSRFDLDLLVTGAVGPTLGGEPDPDYSTFVAYDNPWAGLKANLDLIHENVLAPTLTGDGTRPFTLTFPGDSPDTTADVTVVPRLDLQDKLRWVHRYKLTISVAAGRFA